MTLAIRLLVLAAIFCTALSIETGLATADGPPEKPITEACFGPIADGGVDVCGILNPNSSAKVGYYFAYNEGSTCTGGAKTTPGQIEGEDVAVKDELTGLASDTLYSYCLVATNDFGETVGRALSFEFHLPEAPPQEPITEACPEPDLGGGAWLLCGTLNPEFPPSTPVAYFFAYDDDGSCAGGEQTAVGPSHLGKDVAVSMEVTRLVAGTVYSYCLVAVNTYGETYGASLSFETPEAPPAEGDQQPALAPPAVPLLPGSPDFTPDQSTALLAAKRRFLKRVKACGRKSTHKRRVRCRRRVRASYERTRKDLGVWNTDLAELRGRSEE